MTFLKALLPSLPALLWAGEGHWGEPLPWQWVRPGDIGTGLVDVPRIWESHPGPQHSQQGSPEQGRSRPPSLQSAVPRLRQRQKRARDGDTVAWSHDH